MIHSRTLRMLRALAPGVLLLALVGCEDLSSPGARHPVLFWEGELTPEAAPGASIVQGNVAAITRERVTEIGIMLEGAPPAEPLIWGIFDGTCADPGSLVGAPSNYPLLTASEISHEIVVGRRLEDGNAYHTAVSTEAGADRVACGVLEQVDD